jgi:hypothetical protein
MRGHSASLPTVVAGGGKATTNAQSSLGPAAFAAHNDAYRQTTKHGAASLTNFLNIVMNI